jgi:CheY-like chemotaxis protein
MTSVGHAPLQGVLWVIDNNPADLEIISIVCEMIDFRGRLVTFDGGAQALERLAEMWTRLEDRPDVILLDINMPRLSGMAVLRAIRGDSRWASLPVVMFSTSYNEEPIARDAGATDYVVKPTLLSDTAAAIRRVIARHCKPGSLESDAHV